MKQTRKKYIKEDKLKILNETGLKRCNPDFGKARIYLATFYNWKRKFEEIGEVGLKDCSEGSYLGFRYPKFTHIVVV